MWISAELPIHNLPIINTTTAARLYLVALLTVAIRLIVFSITLPVGGINLVHT